MATIETPFARIRVPDYLNFQARPPGDDLGALLEEVGFQAIASFLVRAPDRGFFGRFAAKGYRSVPIEVKPKRGIELVLLVVAEQESDGRRLYSWITPTRRGRTEGASLFTISPAIARRSRYVVHCLGFHPSDSFVDLHAKAIVAIFGVGEPLVASSFPTTEDLRARGGFRGPDIRPRSQTGPQRRSSSSVDRAGEVRDRFIQAETSVREDDRFVRAKRGLIAGKPAQIVVWIGEPKEGSQRLDEPFNVSALPPEAREWRLTVWLSEPNHFGKDALSREIVLPKDGDSTRCAFEFDVKSFERFEGRLSVVYEGRVIQTAIVAGEINGEGLAPKDASEPVLKDAIRVISHLEGKRHFDLAFVLNHTLEDKPLAVAMSKDHAWVSAIEPALRTAATINNLLRPLATSAVDFAEGIEGEKGRKLLIELAQQGGFLFQLLVSDNTSSGELPWVDGQEFVQVTNTRAECFVPFEFMYTHQPPLDDAELCPHWRTAVEKGQCTCDQCEERVCPMGFWALQKVIERHELRPSTSGKDAYVEAESSWDRNSVDLGRTVVVGASERVVPKDLDSLLESLSSDCGMEPKAAIDWKAWKALVKAHSPGLLLALPHTSGELGTASLEIGNDTRKSITLGTYHVKSRKDAPAPVVALLGCDAAGTADGFASHIVVFRRRGAAIVLSTATTILGSQAVTLASLVAKRLAAADGGPVRLGEALRALKRQAILDNMILPLCLVAFGDADWQVVRQRKSP